MVADVNVVPIPNDGVTMMYVLVRNITTLPKTCFAKVAKCFG